MRSFIWILSVLLLMVLAVIVSTFLFLGVGYIFSIIVPLSIFENAVLAIGSTFVVSFCIAALIICIQTSQHGLFIPRRHHLDEEFDEDDEEYEDEYDYDYEDDYDDENTLNPPLVAKNAPKIGRNEPCPCGSGLKYKRCCGK